MQLQAEPSEPLPKLLQETLGVGPVLKAHDKIVGIPDPSGVCLEVGWALEPGPATEVRQG
jgi:hypothetical protein